jgi:hypothetical protein
MAALHFNGATGALRVPSQPVPALDLDALRLRLDCLPPEMLAARRWLLWKAGKLPFYPSGRPRQGRLDSQDDLDRLGTLADALATLARDAAYLGLGFALGYDPELGKHWQGLDLDAALAGHDFTTERGRALYEATDGYAERSPSGAGLHVMGLGEPFRAVKWKRPGEQAVELYSAGRFFTVTGLAMRDGGLPDLAPLAARVRADLLAAGKVRERKARAAVGAASGDYFERMPPNLREWVRAHPIEAALAEHGYQREGDRWLSPRSESGIPGVVVLDEHRACTFHASDTGIGTEVAGDGEVFNAFDLAVRYRFADDRRAALRTLVERTSASQPASPGGMSEGVRDGDGDASPPRFAVLTADELAALPPIRWRVRGVLPECGLAAVYGPSGSGKSFLVLDLLGAVAEGRSWFGNRTNPCPVTYLALEGEAGIAQRMNAYRIRHGRAPSAMCFVAAPFALLDPADVQDLAEAIRGAGGAGGIVAVDTLNRSAAGADENDSRDMGRLIEGAKSLQGLLGGLVLLVHHAGKDLSKGLRGHSSLHAALDAVVEVTRDGDRREWRIAKAKDGRDGDSVPFRLAVVEVGEDDEGEPITSCVVESVARADGPPRPALPAAGSNQRISWEVLGELLRAAGVARPQGVPSSLPTGRPVVRIEAAVDAIAPRLVAIEERRRRERATEAIRGLCRRALLCHESGWLWCA